MPLAAPQEPHAEVFASSSRTRKKSQTESAVLGGFSPGERPGEFFKSDRCCGSQDTPATSHRVVQVAS